MKIILILMGILFSSFAQKIYELEPIVITATRYPKNIMDITRTIIVIDSTEIIKYSSLTEILEGTAGIDIKIRGDGIQADPSIRGSTFQQILVMIDGIRVNDPQTGHHNLNIPVPLSELERIEILRGTASSLYGSDACGGVVNIITKKQKGYGGGLGLGTFGYKYGFCRLATNNLSIDFDTKSSDGYESGYEYSQSNVATRFRTNITNNLNLTAFGGYLNKKFGAKNFYAPYPSWEANQCFFANLNSQWFISSHFLLNPVLSFRTHIDTFVLDREDPSFYANRHQSYTFGGQLINHLVFKPFWHISFGVEGFLDSLHSTRIGQRSLKRVAVYSQIEKKQFNERLILVAGLRDDYYWNIENSINPHLSLAYKPLPSLKLSGSMGSSFRIPSFTELFYQDPANKGDSLLKPENSWEYEFSILKLFKKLRTQFTIFLRKTNGDIDWVRKSDERIWYARNIGETEFYGGEYTLEFPLLSWLEIKNSLSYIHANKQLPEGYQSKYLLQIPRVSTITRLRLFAISEIVLNLSFYEEMENRVTLNFIVNREQPVLKRLKMSAYLSITNILDNRYYDFQDVPLPGRALRVGIITKF